MTLHLDAMYCKVLIYKVIRTTMDTQALVLSKSNFLSILSKYHRAKDKMRFITFQRLIYFERLWDLVKSRVQNSIGKVIAKAESLDEHTVSMIVRDEGEEYYNVFRNLIKDINGIKSSRNEENETNIEKESDQRFDSYRLKEGFEQTIELNTFVNTIKFDETDRENLLEFSKINKSNIELIPKIKNFGMLNMRPKIGKRMNDSEMFETGLILKGMKEDLPLLNIEKKKNDAKKSIGKLENDIYDFKLYINEKTKNLESNIELVNKFITYKLYYDNKSERKTEPTKADSDLGQSRSKRISTQKIILTGINEREFDQEMSESDIDLDSVYAELLPGSL